MIHEFSVTPPAPAGVLSHFGARRRDDARLVFHRAIRSAALTANVVRTVAALVANRRAVIGRIVRHTRVEIDTVELHLAEVFLGARIADSVFQLLLCKARR